jgi:hypothetical protein
MCIQNNIVHRPLWINVGFELGGRLPDQRKLVYASIPNLLISFRPLAATNAQAPADSRVAEQHDNRFDARVRCYLKFKLARNPI